MDTEREQLTPIQQTTDGFLASCRPLSSSFSPSLLASARTPEKLFSLQSLAMEISPRVSSRTPEIGSVVRKTSSLYSPVQPLGKKKPSGKRSIDANEIRKKCDKDFQRTWESTEVIGGFSSRPRAVQLMNDEPIRFWCKDIEHEDFNEKYKHFELYEKIRAASRAEKSKDLKSKSNPP